MENNEQKHSEELYNSIAAYYNSEEATEAEATPDSVPARSEKPLIAEEYIGEDEITVAEKPKSLMFYIISASVSAAVLLSAFLTGFLSYQPEEDINFRYAHIQLESKDYASALEDINKINEEITVLENEVSEKQAELFAISEFESDTGTLKTTQKNLNDELYNLTQTQTARKKTLEELDRSIQNKAPSSLKLAPGLYTVGENIFSGKYETSGDGMMVVSTSNGSLKSNAVLTSESQPIELNDGDIVKLETEAVFKKI